MDFSDDEDGDGVCRVNWTGGERRGEKNTVELIGERSRGLEVPLRAFCCKARGGGGRLRHATGRMKKEKKQEKEGYCLFWSSRLLRPRRWR